MSESILTHEVLPAGADVPRLIHLGALLEELVADAESAHNAYTTRTPRGPVTGIGALDRELGDVLVPGTHILHAGPGAGKTALVLQIAATCGYPSMFVSCEMSPLELLRRHMARVTGTSLSRLKSGELEVPEVLELAQEACAAAPKLAILDATCTFASAEWIRRTAEAVRGDLPHLLIVLDSLHSWADGVPTEADEYARLGAATGSLRTLAGVLNVPILVVAERNRTSMRTGGMSAGAGSRKIEYGAESVWELDRKDDQRIPGGLSEYPVILTISKNRNGSAGMKIELMFHGALQRFGERQQR